MRRLFRRRPDANEPSINPKSFPVGIRTLYSSEASTVDIVFVHGLTGDRERTWSAQGQVPWPAKFLPHELPNIRVLTFGYDAYVVDVASVVSENRVASHAMNLVTSLATYRERDDTQERPILFVCHSLGGLVCQDTLSQAKQRPESHLKRIYASCRGIIFMGTPHRGAGLAVWGEVLARGLGLIKQTNPAIVEVLTRKSEVLARIQDSFFTLVRSRDQDNLPPLEITCFFEELPLVGLGLVVPRESAAMPGYAPISIRQNHMNMTKFATEEDPGFLAVVGELRRWVRHIAPVATPIETVPTSPQSLTLSEQDFLAWIGPRRYNHVEERVQGTCIWTTETVQFHSWLVANQSSVLWVTGAAGTGKTTLANFLMEQLQQRRAVEEAGLTEHAVCSFFCSREVEGQHDVLSLLQDLVLQLAQPRKKLTRLIKSMYGVGKQEHSMSLEATWRMFETVLKVLPCQSLFIAVDALDECDPESRTKLLKRLANTMSSVTNDSQATCKRVKILLSGQPQIRALWNPANQSIEHHQIDLEDRSTGISHDLELFVDIRVAELVAAGTCSLVTGEYLRQSLKSMAESSFLWLEIVFKHIQQGLGYRTEDLKQILADTPDDLQQAYAKYLPAVKPHDQSILDDYLRILVACSRPLDLVEIDILRAAKEGDPKLLSPAGSVNDGVVRASMQRALGPLVKFPQNKVQFVHSTAREFFLLIAQQPQHPLHESHGIDLCQAHLWCAKACMVYLLSPGIPSDLFDMDRPDSASANIIGSTSNDSHSDDDAFMIDSLNIGEVHFLMDSDNLEKEICAEINQQWQAFDYAANNWAYHLKRAQTVIDDGSIAMSLQLISGEPGRSSDWFRYYRQQSHLQMPSLGEINAVVLAAMFDVPQLLRILLENSSNLLNSQSLSSALFWATSRDKADAVRILLAHGTPARATKTHQVPLAVAAQGGFEGICDVLLTADSIDPNEPNSHGKSALGIAAEADDIQILRRILRHKAVCVDQPDAGGRTAFITAACSGSLQSLEVLRADGRAHINLADRKGRTALLCASHAGHLPVVRELLKMADLAMHDTDASGRNAISLASQQGHAEVVKQLFKRGIDPSSLDSCGRNSISWAANSLQATQAIEGKESVLEYLVRKAPHAADTPDWDAWTPLAWALDTPGYLKSVKILLKSPEVDVNRRDGQGRCPLAWAASAGMTEIVKCFLKRPDVDVNAASRDGRTPLSDAAANGMTDVVRLLLQYPAIDVAHQNHKGWTAADWAGLNGHLDIVDLLQKCGRMGSTDQ